MLFFSFTHKMDTDFHKFASNTDFLTYDEYVRLSLSHLQKPLPITQIGTTIFIQDIRKIQLNESQSDYSELFELFSENGRITYGSLRNIIDKVGIEVSDNDVLNMIKYFDRSNKTELNSDDSVSCTASLGIEEFNLICDYGKKSK